MEYDDIIPEFNIDNNGKLSLSNSNPQVDLITGRAPTPSKSFVPAGIKDSRDRRKLIYSGNKSRINNIILRKIIESQGVEVPDNADDSTLETIFKTLDWPGSKVRSLITGRTAKEGNSFSDYIKDELKLAPYSEAWVPPASDYRTGKQNPMAINPMDEEVIPGTNIRRHAYDVLQGMGHELSQPEFHARAAATTGGIALDMLTDPLMLLGPGIFKKMGGEGGRALLALETPALTGIPSKMIRLSPKILDDKLFEVMGQVGKKIGETKVGKVIGKALIPGFGLPKDYYLFHRDTVDKINYEVQKLYREADTAFQGLSDDELKMVSHYVEGTQELDNLPAEVASRVTTAATKYRELQSNFTRYLKENGILRTGLEENDQYVPHIYPGITQDTSFRTGEKLEIKPRDPFFTKQRTHETLRDSIDAGNVPLENIDEIFKEYGRHGITEVGKRGFINDTLDKFGHKAQSIADAKNIVSNDSTLGIYAPKGAFKFHPEQYVPKRLLNNADDVIELSIDDLKTGLMMSKNVPVYILPKEVARDMNRLEKVFGDEFATKKFLKMYDDFTAWWKGRVTVTSPGFHIRNGYSNIFNAYLGGLEDLGRYKKAIDVVSGKTGRFAGKDYEVIKDLAERYGVYSPTAGHWMREIFGPEVLRDAKVSELVNPLAARTAPVEIGRKVGSAIENNARMALFMDRLAKGDTPMQASLHVKKYLFDYSELTPMERNFFRRVVPFYTWMRKNIPLQLEGLATNPKAASNLGKLTGNRFGEENETPYEDRNFQFKNPMSVQLTDGSAPAFMKLDFPIGDLDFGSRNLGLHPLIQVGAEALNILNGKDEADTALPEIFSLIYNNLPEEAKKHGLPMVPSRNTDNMVPGIDPTIKKSINTLLPLFSKVSRLLPTEENLADPNYEARLSSYFTGVPVQRMDIKRNKALQELVTKSLLKETLNKAYKEGTLDPNAIMFLRSNLKVK